MEEGCRKICKGMNRSIIKVRSGNVLRDLFRHTGGEIYDDGDDAMMMVMMMMIYEDAGGGEE